MQRLIDRAVHSSPNQRFQNIWEMKVEMEKALRSLQLIESLKYRGTPLARLLSGIYTAYLKAFHLFLDTLFISLFILLIALPPVFEVLNIKLPFAFDRYKIFFYAFMAYALLSYIIWRRWLVSHYPFMKFYRAIHMHFGSILGFMVLLNFLVLITLAAYVFLSCH